ncbi:MAG: hypothetical protein AAGJ52_12855 [Pseudomonadota bacterium]
MDEPRTVNIGSTDERPYFEVEAAGLFNLSSRGEVDIVCRLMDASGNAVAEDDDSGQDMNCSITSILPIGRYEVDVAGFANDDKGETTIIFRSLGSEDVAIGDAVSIAVGSETGAAVAFEVETEGGYLMTSSGQVDTVCRLFNESGVEISSDDDSGDGFNCALSERLVPGQYHVVVSSFGSDGGNATFMVMEYEIKSYALELNTPHSARIDMASDSVEFEVLIADSGRYWLHTSGDMDTVCQLKSHSGELMDENDDGDDMNCSINHALPAGNYRFVVSGYGSETGSFTAHLDRR